MADNKKIYSKLPAVQQTTAIKNFFESTVEQLFSKANTESIQGFIGSPRGEDVNVSGEYLQEPTATKRFYGLSPTVNTVNPDTGESENLIFYDELIDVLGVYGVDTRNHNKIFGETYAAFMPPVDPDKLINYSEYYWVPQGPSTILVQGNANNPVDIDSDVIGKPYFTAPNGKPFRNGMIVQFSGDFVIPQSKAYTDYIVEGVGSSIMLLPKKDNFSTRFTTASETEYDYFTYTLAGQADAGYANTAFSAGTVDAISITNPGRGYVAPQLLIYDDALLTDETLVQQYPQFTTLYLDENGNNVEVVNLEQVILYLSELQDTAEFTQIASLIDTYRTGDRAVATVTLDETGGINSASVTQIGIDYAGEVKIAVYDEHITNSVDTANISLNNGGSDQYVTNTLYMNDVTNVKVGQVVSGYVNAIVTQVTQADVPANILASIVLDRDVEIKQVELEAAPVLRFRGVGFNSLAIRNDVNVLGENTTTLLTTQAKVGINPNDPRDYFFTGGTRSWDNDLNGDGIGDQAWAGLVTQSEQDYILQQRGAANRNVWSRVNFWYHKNNFLDAGDPLPNREFRAERPIIEFDRSLELYNHATRSAGTVIFAADQITLEDLSGSPSTTTVDGVPVDGATFIFPIEDPEINKYIYTARTDGATGTLVITRVGDPILNPPLARDGDSNFVPFEAQLNQGVQILSGQYNIGKEYVFNGTNWDVAQEKLTVNQAPLFNLYDDSGVALDDISKYPASDFSGNKIFGYATTATEPGSVLSTSTDPVLGFPVVFKQYKASSEIVFANHQQVDRYSFQNVTDSFRTSTDGYYFYKNTTTGNFHSYWQFGDTPYKQRIISTYRVTQFDVDNQRRSFSIGCIPNRDADLNSGYNIIASVNGKPRTDFTYGNFYPSFIDFDNADFVAGDFIEISALSDQGVLTNQNSSKFEMPISWGRNPYNQDIEFTSEPEYLEHLTNYMKAQVGFSGDVLAANNFSNTTKNISFAKNIVYSNSNPALAAMLLDDQPYNLVNALRFSAQEFSKYKARFKHELNTYYNTYPVDGLTNEQLLEQVLRQLISFKVGREVFNRTYIIPFGDNTTVEQFTLAVDQDTVVLSASADLNLLENSLLVYKNDNLMCIDRCYEIINFDPITIKIYASPKTGDKIVAKLYNANRDSAQCPPTPSTMGITPLVQPEIILDDTFSTPLEVIVGHDGSKTPTYGDLRDQILLDFEYRIYNSAKGEFREKNSILELNPLTVREGAFRSTGYSYNEWVNFLRHGFSRWVTENNLDPVTNEFYDENDPWTWNYGSDTLPGHWRGIYEFYYDTDQPHTHPWEMLGFTEQPLWWEDAYGTDYSSKNTAMWNDLEQGIIRQGPRQNINGYLRNNPFRRIGLHQVIPVDENSQLIPPANLITTGTTQLVQYWDNLDTGDHDPDFAFRTSSYQVIDGVQVSYDDNNVYVQSQALVNHALPVDVDVLTDYTTLYGSPVKQQPLSYAIPRGGRDLNAINQNPTAMPKNQAVAVAVNGLPIYTMDYDQSWNDEEVWFYDHTRMERNLELDYFESHTDGVLHYHAVMPQIVGLTDWDTGAHSPIVGWAFDGLPIYGPYGYSDPLDANSNLTRMKSPWSLRDGLRTSGPGGAFTGVFIQDYRLDTVLEGSPTNGFRNGYVNRYNMRYAITPDSPTQPIWHYVVTVDDNHDPVFPYHVGGGVKNIDQWAGTYYAGAIEVGGIGAVNVIDQGGLYTTATITITGDGQGATADAVIEDGKIIRVDITDPGRNYTHAEVTLTGDGVRAKLEIELSTTGNNFNNAPVNSDATKSITSENVKTFTVTGNLAGQWKFGDISPAEYAWIKSESYMYSVAEAMLIAKPALFAKVFSDPVSLYRPAVNKKFLLSSVTKEGWDFRDPTQFKVHGDKDATGKFVTNVGYTQFINSWLQFQGLDTFADFVKPMRSLNFKLAHRMSGFVDKDTMTVRTDQYSNDGKATSLIVPKENIHVSMHPSNYKTRSSYSGVVIEKTAAGYTINGYDKTRGYFEVFELDKTGAKRGVEVGGTPAAYVVWEPNSSYAKGTIVQHLNNYYTAPVKINDGSTFDRSVWTRLPALPQEQAASAVLYTKTTGTVKRVNYQTLFTDVQELYDFFIGLNLYTNYIGYDYGEYNTAINAASDWEYAAKQFLFWTTGKWEIGNTLELSPMATEVKFIAPRGFISEIKRQDREQFNIVDYTGTVIDPSECEISREDSAIVIKPPSGREIYGIVLYTKEIDHALVVDNVTEFNDVIYDPLIDQKHRRLKVKATRTANWTGKLLTEGFIIDQDELLPNLDNLAETMGRYQELGFVPVDKTVYNITRSQYGYTERSYLRDLDILDEQQFDFYRGMIQNKGTSESLTRIARSSSVVQGNVTVYDEWALRVGDFGDTENDQSVELKITKGDIVAEPQLIQTVLPEDITYGVEEINVIQARYKYSEVPRIVISAPTSTPAVQATAQVVLDENGKIASVDVTNGGSGYDPDQQSQISVIAAETVTDSTSTKLSPATAEMLPGYIEFSGVNDMQFTITDHIADTIAPIVINTAPDDINIDDIVNAINGITTSSVLMTTPIFFDPLLIGTSSEYLNPSLTGQIQFDRSNIQDVTRMYISATDAQNLDVIRYLKFIQNNVNKGTFTVYETADNTKYATFIISNIVFITTTGGDTYADIICGQDPQSTHTLTWETSKQSNVKFNSFVPNVKATAMETLFNDGVGETAAHNVLITGKDFSVANGSEIKIQDGRYQPKQRFGVVAADVTDEYQTTANDVIVQVDGVVIPRTTDTDTNWHYTAGQSLIATVDQSYPIIDTSTTVDGKFPVDYSSVTLPLSGNLNVDNIVRNDKAQYEFIELYINGVKITNSVDSYSSGQLSAQGTLFTLTENTITFPDIRRLPRNVLTEFLNPPAGYETTSQRESLFGFTTDTTITVVEKSVVEFDLSFEQDIPGSTVAIQVTTKEGILVRIAPKRTYAITPDLLTDEVITIDIDDNERFVKKPISVIGDGLWPVTTEVNHTGLTDPKYINLRNAGYVRPEDVNFRAFDLGSLPDLYSDQLIIHPKSDDFIHIAKSEDNDWNVYRLDQIDAEQRFLFRNEDGTVSLLTDYSLFNYLDTNQIGEEATGKYLDYYLALDNNNISDNVVVWTNEDIVKSKQYSLTDYKAPRMIEARIQSIRPRNLQAITAIEPARGKTYNGVEISQVSDLNDVITLRGLNFTEIAPGDLVSLKNNIGTVVKYDAAVISVDPAVAPNQVVIKPGYVESITITDGGSGYTDVPTVTIADSSEGSLYTAEGKATISASITGATVTDTGGVVGSTADMPELTITGTNTQPAAGTVSIINAEIIGFEIIDAGSGYTSPPSITITGASTTQATALVTTDNIGNSGELLEITPGDFGAGYSSDTATVTVHAPSGNSGRTAVIVPILRGNATVSMSSTGSGYNEKAVIDIDSPEVESVAPVFNATVTGVELPFRGVGYYVNNPPAVTFTGANTTPAAGTAVVNSGMTELASALQSSTARVTLRGTPSNTLQWRIDPPLTEEEQQLLADINAVNNENFTVVSHDANGEFTLESPLFANADVASNLERTAYYFTIYADIDSTEKYTVLTTTPTTLTIIRPDSAVSYGLQLVHHNQSKIVVPSHTYSVGDIVRISTNTFRGMYKIRSTTPESFIVQTTYLPGFENGDVIQEGLEIKTTSPHGITSMYAAQGKRIAVHFSEPLYYNKVYPVSQVTTDTIIIDGFWPKDRRTHVFYEQKYATLNASVPYEAGNPAADFTNATNVFRVTDDVRLENDQLATYSGNGSVISPSMITVVGGNVIVDPAALPGDPSISVDIDFMRQLRRQSDRYPILTTMDHNRVVMNGSTITVDSFNNPEAIVSSINRNIKLHEQFTNTDSGKFSIKFGMLKDPSAIVADGKKAEEISDYGPYLRDPNLIKQLSDGELEADGELALGSDDEQRVDEEFNQGPDERGPTRGIRYTDLESGIEYIWSFRTNSYRAMSINDDPEEYEDGSQGGDDKQDPPEYHTELGDVTGIPDWVVTEQSTIDSAGPNAVIYPTDTIVKHNGAYYVAIRDITAQYNQEFLLVQPISEVETEFWRKIQDPALLQELVNNFLILTSIPGTGTAAAIKIGSKKQFYIMGQEVLFTNTEAAEVTLPRYRLEPNNYNSFMVYEAVQNTDGDIYYVKIDSSAAPAYPHDYYGTVNQYSDFFGYPKTTFYYDNDIALDLDVNDKVSNINDPIRLRNTGKVIGVGEVEPAAYIGRQTIPEPFAIEAGNNSNAVQNILGLPPLSVSSPDATSRASVQVLRPGFNSFLMWTAGLTPNEWIPTQQGPGNLPGISDNPTVLGFGRGYYKLNGTYPDSYPEVAGLRYDRPIPRLMYSRNFSVYPGVQNVDYIAYQAEDGTIIDKATYDAAMEAGENMVNGYQILELVEVTISPEFVDAADEDPANTGLRPEDIWVSCFWTEPFTYVNQLVDWDYNNIDANGIPAPIYGDYDGTVTRVKYIRLTEVPPDAYTRRLIPDTGWAGKSWTNRRSDDIDFATVPEDEIWELFDPQTYEGGSSGDGGNPDTTTISVGDVGTTTSPTATGTQPTVTSDGALITEADLQDVVPTTEVGPILSGAVLAGLPGPCERIDLPQDNINPTINDSDCSTVNKARFLDAVSKEDFEYASTDSTVKSIGFVEKELAGIEDVRVFFNTGIFPVESGWDKGTPYHITVVQSTTPYSTALANNNTNSWWADAIPILLHTLYNGEGSRNDGTQLYSYGVDSFNSVGTVIDPVISERLGGSNAAVSEYATWAGGEGVSRKGTTPAAMVTLSNGVYQTTGGDYDTSMVQGLGFMINYGVNCLDGKYLTVFVATKDTDEDGEDINIKNQADNRNIQLVIDYYGEYIEPEIDPDIVLDEACLQAGSRAYQQGAVLKEWDGDGKNAYFGTNNSNGEFRERDRRNIDNIYFPYARPSSCKSIAQDRDGARFEVTSDIESGKSALNSRITQVSSRTIQSLGKISIPDTRTIEIKGYFKAPVTGLYEFYADADDAGWMWLSSAWGKNHSNSVIRLGVNDLNELAFDKNSIPGGTEFIDGTKLDYLLEDYSIRGGFFTKDGPPDYSKFSSLEVTSGGGMNFVDQTDLHGYQNTPYYTRDNCVLRTGWHTTKSRNNEYGINNTAEGPYGDVRVKVALKQGEYYFVRIMAGNKHGPGYIDLRYNVSGSSPLSGVRLNFSGKFCETDNPPAPDAGSGIDTNDDLWWNYDYNNGTPYASGYAGTSDDFEDYSEGLAAGPGGDLPTTSSSSSNSDAGSFTNQTTAQRAYEKCCADKGISSQIFGGVKLPDAQVECYYRAFGSFPSGTSQSQQDAVLATLNGSSESTTDTSTTDTSTTDTSTTDTSGNNTSSVDNTGTNTAAGSVVSQYCEVSTALGSIFRTGMLITVYSDGKGGTYTTRTADVDRCPPGSGGGGGGDLDQTDPRDLMNLK